METYYKQIVYKKNAFEDLKTYIKLNYNKKNILLVSTKNVQAEDVTKLLNALFCGSENVSHFVVRENFTISELDEINKKINNGNFNLIVSLGGGKCCDVVKYFAYEHKLAYIVCPTVATSLSYFSNYCVNPYDATKSFYANMPNKIFIQESIIKNANCLTNINGLCFLHALRAVYIEGLIGCDEKDAYIYVGLEKLFSKLEYEQTNILLCGEDSNLVLMDLMIDFGFFIGMIDKEKFYLFNMYFNYLRMTKENNSNFSGKTLLLCCKAIITAIHKYYVLNTVNIIEKVNFSKIASVISEKGISYKVLKNNNYFKKINEKVYLKVDFFNNRDNFIKIIDKQLSTISEFCKKVKNVYKYGIEVYNNFENIFSSLLITPYLYKSCKAIDLMANSGILNGLM